MAGDEGRVHREREREGWGVAGDEGRVHREREREGGGGWQGMKGGLREREGGRG